MSSGGVREAIWALIDGSRRTTASMFSRITPYRPAVSATLSGTSRGFLGGFSLSHLSLQCVSCCVTSVFPKMDEKLGMRDCLVSGLAELREKDI